MLLSGHGAANGAAFQLIEQNASGLGNAFAGQAAAAEDASAVFFNPAGLTRLGGRQAVGALHVIAPRSRFGDSGSCTAFVGTGVGTASCPFGDGGNLGHAAGGNGGDAGDLAALPNVYLSWELLPGRLWAGVGLNAPFGLKTEWDADWVGRFQAVRSQVKTVNINPTLAWKLDDRISFGGGLNLQRLDAKLSNAVSYRAVALASGNAGLIGAVAPGSEGIADVQGDDWGVGWNVGAMVQLSESLRLGVSYRSTIRYTLTGDVRFDNRPAALGAVPNVADGNVKVNVRLPDTFSIALAHQTTPRLQLLVDWTWTGWDSVQTLAIDRTSGALAGQTLTSLHLGFGNSWRAGLGANYQLSDAWKLRGGVAYDTTPVRDALRSPRLPDEDRIWVAVGAQWGFAPNAALDVGLAHIEVRNASSSLPNQETATSAPRGSLVGRYSAGVDIVGAQVRWNF